MRKLLSFFVAMALISQTSGSDAVTRRAILEMDSDDSYFIANKELVISVCSNLLKKEKDKKVIVLLRERRGDAYALLKDHKRAREDWEAGLELDPKNARLRWRHAVLSTQDSLAKAQKELEELLKETPDFANAWITLAVVSMGKGDFVDGLRKAGKAIDLGAKSPLAYYTRGVAFALLGKFKEALDDLNRCIELDSFFPAGGHAYLARGTVLLGLGDYKKAANDFARAIQFKREDAGRYYGLWKCNWAMGRWNLCFVQAKEMFKQFPLDDRSHLTMCSSFVGTGKPKEALFHGEQAVSIAPRNPNGYRELALAHFYLGDYALAFENLDKALEVSPDDLRSLHSKVVLRSTCPEKKYRDGRQAMELALRFKKIAKEPSTDASFLLAISYAENGEFGKAVDAAKEFRKKESTGKFRKEIDQMIESFGRKEPVRIAPTDNNLLPLLFSSREFAILDLRQSLRK
jgi:tetratricopeptide (TPR) repeat protein